ncbi:putative M20/M25/M40-family peptidase [Actinoplanes missouriensis 431]|uniref:Putative M20/M25/M40-family peptidase n=1 Tax=Actinoplanes missouriensis (strain ATCC 14538 / DSM 43046 / CBS 188.64 / JCM 3121 / NBRC 102363 / NCIMB 12654 / NRRL B-3342 / UNCC 431) TaxID=512565 RepID=I0GZI6_ACTM4|nr:allantoate amidohydrolase [Actinoplanes missouriensis]BAL86173.1 putative M20/M25/M40-family peptidase [Actinoplanes missouriensis 431]
MSDFTDLWNEIAPIGRADSGGYLRYALTEPELTLRDWFRTQAARRDMLVTDDGNGNLFAWRGEPWAPGTVLTGSHFDSVPHGGGYDGPLGIVSAFLAADRVAKSRSIAIAAFCEEEGGRFGVPCLGSRLLTGAIAPQQAGALKDRDGISFAEALGKTPDGAQPARIGNLKAFVELHVEQGRALETPVGVASAIWPHGRWRMDFAGVGDHAGTTRMTDRHDPMLTFAFAVLAANKEARLTGAHATVGRVQVEPNATNAIPSLVRGWLDARAADTGTLDQLVDGVVRKVTERAGRDGTSLTVTPESVTDEVAFDEALAKQLAARLGNVPILPTGAGHDAGVLSAHVPTAMLFVRNPTGVSHSPAEHATDEDCEAGIEALAAVLEELS